MPAKAFGVLTAVLNVSSWGAGELSWCCARFDTFHVAASTLCRFELTYAATFSLQKRSLVDSQANLWVPQVRPFPPCFANGLSLIFRGRKTPWKVASMNIINHYYKSFLPVTAQNACHFFGVEPCEPIVAAVRK
jgi:hypothetical protein